MPTLSTLLPFVGAAVLLALMPGPGQFYVVGRTLSGGRAEGIASVLGTGLGGMVHVLAGALGVSALVMTSTTAFTVLKIVGGAYLIHLGIQTWRRAGAVSLESGVVRPSSLPSVLRQGFMVEAMNPKTAAFFLALIPQFVDPVQGSITLQFVVLGAISVAVNMANALLVVMLATVLQRKVGRCPGVMRRLQQGSGAILTALGVSLLVTRRPAV